MARNSKAKYNGVVDGAYQWTIDGKALRCPVAVLDTEEVKARALELGVKTHIQNSWAAADMDAYPAGEKVISDLISGKWRSGRESAVPTVDELADAAVAAGKAAGKMPIPAAVRDKVKMLSVAKRKAYAAIPEIAKYLGRKAPKPGSLDDLL